MLTTADEMAYERVQVMTDRIEWFPDTMTCYAALFLGPPTNVANGDKVIGTDHTLPTRKTSRYTGGLWVGEILRTPSYQRVEWTRPRRWLVNTVPRLCMLEGFVGLAEQCKLRVRRYGGRNISFAAAAD